MSMSGPSGRRFEVLAHRGASAYTPENTHAAFRRAIEMGADGIETDVQASADGVLVLVHDARVDRTSNGSGRVADLTLAELQALDAGAWFAPEFAGERIVTLADCLDTYGGKIPLCLEVKAPGVEAALVEAVRQRDLLGAVQFTSFNFEAAANCRRLASETPIVGFLTRDFDAPTIERCRDAGLSQICPHVDSVTTERVNMARAAGLGVRAWSISAREQVDRIANAGVDGATINWPDWRPRLG